MPTTDISKMNYRKLFVSLPSLPTIPEYAKSTVPGDMDLHLDCLSNVYTVLSLSESGKNYFLPDMKDYFLQ